MQAGSSSSPSPQGRVAIIWVALSGVMEGLVVLYNLERQEGMVELGSRKSYTNNALGNSQGEVCQRIEPTTRHTDSWVMFRSEIDT